MSHDAGQAPAGSAVENLKDSAALLSLDQELELGRSMADARKTAWLESLHSPAAARCFVELADAVAGGVLEPSELLAEADTVTVEQLAKLRAAVEQALAAAPQGEPVRLKADGRALAVGLPISETLFTRIAEAHQTYVEGLRALPRDRRRTQMLERLGPVEQAFAESERKCRAAQAILIRTHLRFVVAVARSHRGRGVDLGDLVQEGNLGLMRAAQKFDYRMGCRFNTYAMYWIRATIRACIANQSRTIRVPTRRLQTLARVRRAQRKLENISGRSPTESELAHELGCSIGEVRDALDVPRDAISIGVMATDEDPEAGFERIADRSDEGPLIAAMDQRESEEARSLLGVLTPREAQILKLRFGIDERTDHTLEEIGQMFGVTRERIRQIEARALSKLRSIGRERGLDRLAG